jgi:hypothetical protein
MVKPTEQEKKDKNTEHKGTAKITTADGTEKDVDIVTKTKPNNQGGYDTEIHVPVGHVGVRRVNPGGQPIGG